MAGNRRIFIGVAAAALVVSGATIASANVNPGTNANQYVIEGYGSPKKLKWTVMGDSTVAGLIVQAGEPDEPDVAGKEGCGRRDRAWPFLLKAEFADSLTQINKSCGGAEQQHIYLKGQYPLGFISVNPDFTIAPDPFATVTNPEQPNLLAFPQIRKQIDYARVDTDLITIGITLNDFEIGRLTARCSIKGLNAFPGVTSPCKNDPAVQADFDLPGKAVEFRAGFFAMLQALRAKSPHAEIIANNYMSIIPDDTTTCAVGIHAAAMREFGPQRRGDLNWERDEVYEVVNSIIKEETERFAATDGHTHFLDLYEDSLGHDACQPSNVKWFEGIKDVNGEFPLVHGNENAHKYTAAKYEALIRQVFAGRL